MKKIIIKPEGVEEVNLTINEIKQAENNDIEFALILKQKEAKEAQEKARKESAIAKLKALGLTEEEVKSIL